MQHVDSLYHKTRLNAIPNRTKSDIGARIRTIRDRSGITQRAWAESYGKGQSTWAAYESGKRQPDLETLSLLHLNEGVNLNWLLTGTGDAWRTSLPVVQHSDDDSAELESIGLTYKSITEGEFTRVPIYDMPMGAGGGGDGEYSNEIRGYGKFLSNWLRDVVRLNNPANAFVAPVYGDSMADFLMDGDLVIGEFNQNIDTDGTWAVVYDSDILVKHVDKPRGHHPLILKSENRRFDDIEVRDGISFYVIGRVLRRITP